jgi:hypothetical protein
MKLGKTYRAFGLYPNLWNKVIETVAQNDNEYFRFAQVYILENAAIVQKFGIALIQGRDIVGVSPLIEVE